MKESASRARLDWRSFGMKAVNKELEEYQAKLKKLI